MSGWTLWARKAWTDLEPDTFYMSVESSTPDAERCVVVSGNATWLSADQAEEVQEFLGKCIALCRQGPARGGSDSAEPMAVMDFFREQREQSRALDENGFRVE